VLRRKGVMLRVYNAMGEIHGLQGRRFMVQGKGLGFRV
jgi:hypothetical protein